MTKVEKLREKVLTDVRSNWYEMTTLEDGVVQRETAELVDSLIAAAREEGAEFMKARILEQSYLKDVFSNPLVTLPADFYIVPASVLSPSPKEKL